MKRLLYKKLMLVLAITRSVVYKKRQPEVIDEDECLLLQLLDEEYTRHPFYGARRMTQYLRGLGYVINRKRVQRLMRTLGLAGMAPRPNTSKRHPQHKLYRYLLRGVDVIAPNQVWSTDITYIRLLHGFGQLHGGADSTGHHHQHGRAGACAGQYLC
jgi:putative transposase